MAQLVKHSTRHSCLLWLHQLAAISLPSPSAGNLTNETSEKSWSFQQLWLPCKNLSSVASVEKFQETENSVEIKLDGGKSSNYSKIMGEVLKGHTIKENARRRLSHKKSSHQITSSSQCMKDKGAVPEEQGTLETSTVTDGGNVETSGSSGSPMEEGSSGKVNDNLKYAQVRKLEGEKVTGFNPKGHLNMNSNNSSSVPDTASTTSQSKKGWARILSENRDLENAQNISDSAAPESQFPSVQPIVQTNLILSSESGKAALTPANFGFTVCVEQHSLNLDVSAITALLSLYGSIEGSFRRMRVDGIWITFVKFKTKEGKENALAARWLNIGGRQLAIRRIDQLMTTVVRISNTGPETNVNRVLYKCGSWGRVDNVKTRGKGMFDVYFKVKELPNMMSILDSLNSVSLNHRQWKALPAPLVHPQAVKSLHKKLGGKSWYYSQQLEVIDRMEAAIDNLMVDLQDLQELCDLRV